MAGETPPEVRQPIVPTAKLVGTVVVSATGVVALVTDVLAPLGPIALWFAGGAALLCLACWLSKWFVPLVDDLGKPAYWGYWRMPVALTLLVSSCVLLVTYGVTRSAPTGGWLGSHVSMVRDAQTGLGVLDARTQEIADTTQVIKKDTQVIKKDTQVIKKDTQAILAELGKVKKETSDDPRKELANLGVPWSTQGFVDALQGSDARAVKLFLEGGMSPTALHNGASVVLYILQAKLPDPVPMLELLIEAGFDVNANLFDGKILRHYSDSLPPHFESPDLPDDYVAVFGTFEGPALLWLVIRSSYGFPIEETWDVSVIGFFKSQGADTKLSKQFLDAMESAWEEYPAYRKVRAAIL